MSQMPHVVYNGEPQVIDAETSVADFLAARKLDPRRVAVEINLNLVPRQKHAEVLLTDGDRVEVVTLVGGG
jgi:sulfur carrier protein